jgi:hypothetical protein
MSSVAKVSIRRTILSPDGLGHLELPGTFASTLPGGSVEDLTCLQQKGDLELISIEYCPLTSCITPSHSGELRFAGLFCLAQP